ncbi:SusC/RagA family TonB-linked outer membrane protein [Zobellia galactanivorans]|uniref:SusC/RagA family TonB-linked outer membrane protein n=1 Tax=Zobellia galactanivorans (strain DSM 12802 / CCUG 47099 / CIP 106680 / NCIMB 13871 / Dsij) TaxID=63186 RepID=UPI001C065487|nr:SusC/RagA family TonB-linked outer membrane protein [Zobellia galactanivorans]MBU3027921.1 SusC/RagA family TonB-linked outer membrane protein [Zobellia galactanivorans]
MRTILFFCLTAAFSLIPNNLFSQDAKIIINTDKNIPVVQVFELIHEQLGYRFIYNDELIDNTPILELKKGEILVKDLLQMILSPINCDYKFTEDGTIIIKKIVSSFSLKGTIVDNKGDPIPGANIVEEGTSNGVQSDFDGNFTLQVSEATATIIISYLGFMTQDVAINNRKTVNITLIEEISKLDEVFVTALGIKRKRKELGYSFQEVTGDDLSNNPTLSIAQSLYGKVAGVNISQTAAGVGASSRVIIRGNNSINGDNQPLYIVDGVYLGNSGIGRITGDKSEKFTSGIDNGDGLSSLNIDDIENISVLKGGAASALYGERGANGVIVITTKKGKNNSFKIDYNATITFDIADAKYENYQTDYGFGSRGILPNPLEINTVQVGTTNAWGPRFGTGDNLARIFDGSFKPYRNVENNIQNFFNIGTTYNNNISFSGGSDNTTYRFGYGNLQNNDVIPLSGLKRNSFSLRATTNLNKLLLDGKLSYITEETKNRPALADDPNNIGFSLARLAPNIDQAWLQHYQDNEGNYFEWNADPFRLNPYYVISENSNISTKNRVLGNFNLNYSITDWLKVDTKASIDKFDYNVTDFVNSGTNLPGRQNGGLRAQDISFQEYNIEGTLSASKEFGKYGISVAFGANHRKTKRIDGGYFATDMIQRGINNLSNFSKKTLEGKTNKEILVKSIFSYVRTNYSNLLFLDITARNDWNSTLATAKEPTSDLNNNYSFFYPSVSTSFVFSNALDMSSNILSFGKIRASWASTGKAPEEPFATTPFYTVGSQPLLGQPLGSVGSGVIPNETLKPEISNTYEIGVDLSFFKNRFGIDFSYYKTRTKNQLVVLNISQTSGYFGAWENIGIVENTGIEGLVTAGIFRNPKGFNWDMALNFSKNNNKVIRLNEDTDKQVISIARWAGAQVIAQVGKSSSEIYGQQLQRSPDGQVIIGENGLPKLTGTFGSLGKVTPDWIMGVTNEFSYKGFNLGTSLDMKFGGYVYSMTNAYAAASGLLDQTVEGRDAYNNWVQQQLDEGLTISQISTLTPDAGYIAEGVVEVIDANGDVTYQENTIPVNPEDYWNSLSGENTTPEPFIYDASYIKLRELSIGYSFPSEIFNKMRLDIDQLRLSIIGRNLWTIYSNLPNIDPESTYTSGNGQGFEYGSLPYRKSYGFNIQITF